jgi:hypothetical protein
MNTNTSHLLDADKRTQEAKHEEFTKPLLRSDFTLPPIADWTSASFQYFDNRGIRGKCDHVIKAVISTETDVKEINHQESREVIINLYPMRDFHLKVRDLTERTNTYNENWLYHEQWPLEAKLSTAFSALYDVVKPLFDEQTKKLDAPLTEVVAGWCSVAKKPFGTHLYANMACIMIPSRKIDADGVITYGSTIMFNVDGVWSEEIELKDVSSRKPIDSKTGELRERADGSCKMIGYLDRVNFKDEYKRRKQLSRLLKAINCQTK